MKIGILYICTGKYAIFWEEFYLSCEKFFLPGICKQYFVFTDSESLPFFNESNVKVIAQDKLGWPYDTLRRFEIFFKNRELFNNLDYLFFFNANAKVVNHISSDILPAEDGLIGVEHPCHHHGDPDKYIYHRGTESSAFIPFGKGKHYFMGSFNGGKTKEYLEMCQSLKDNIESDEQKGIIALWHDESHLNSYFLTHRVKVLSPEFAYPEEMKLPYSPKILLRDKNKFGGHGFLRGESSKNTAIKVISKKIKKYYKRLLLVNIQNALKIRTRRIEKLLRFFYFSVGGKSLSDKIKAFYLRSAMETPFETRPKFIQKRIAQKGNFVQIRHRYFHNLALEFNLLDNFEMAICREFFLEHAYDLNKLTFIPERIIDCGAYRGYFTIKAFKYFPKADITAIEAHQDNFKKINKLLSLNHIGKINLFHGAVTATADEFIPLFFEGSNGSVENIFSEKGKQVLVKTINLNNFIDKNNLLLKIDIEGAELEFFPEIINKLPPNCAVFLETHDGWKSLSKIKEKFIEYGFQFNVLTERNQFIDSFAQRFQIKA